ncbi:Techylectin-5B [Exaiptasia diaphana]|nr:Techylectin-5B [Exaiptasia diaphana]
MWKNLLTFRMLILRRRINIRNVSKNGCKDLVYLPCVQNKTFRGHVIKSFRILAPGLQECQSRCFKEKMPCVSYNLGPVSGQVTTCELNDLDHLTHPSDLISKEGSQYCPIKNPCSSNPCSNKELCTPDFHDDTFRCTDGIWSQWGEWCKCSTTWKRVRTCRNLVSNAKADDCPGLSQESNDKITSGKVPSSCSDASHCGCKTSGVYTFKDNLKLFCDQETNGGGWTVIQRRQDGSQDFYLGWQDYKVGFGSLTGEFWLGLDKIHQLTQQSRHSLRVDLEDTVFAEYDNFAVSDESSLYKLTIGNYKGNAGDSLAEHNNQFFSTKDRDNDSNPTDNCAQTFKGAWWHSRCYKSSLNGLYLNGTTTEFAKGIVWYAWKGYLYSAKRAEMKIRPIKSEEN